MTNDFSAALAVLNLCRAAELLRLIYEDSSCRYIHQEMTGLYKEDWNAMHEVLNQLEPLRTYGSVSIQAAEILKRVLVASHDDIVREIYG